LRPSSNVKPPESLRATRIVVQIFATVLVILRSVTNTVTSGKSRDGVKIYNKNCQLPLISSNAITTPNEESLLRPPSPCSDFTESDLISQVMKRLTELECKIETLMSKPTEMPVDKEELLDAAVKRVDALEAELIVTKKVKYEELQEKRSPFSLHPSQ
jgi:hypothetical protein